MMIGMLFPIVPIMLNFGALNALFPVVIIVILIAAAAGLSRGTDMFALFGIGAMLGVGSAMSQGRVNPAQRLKYSKNSASYTAGASKAMNRALAVSAKHKLNVLGKAEADSNKALGLAAKQPVPTKPLAPGVGRVNRALFATMMLSKRKPTKPTSQKRIIDKAKLTQKEAEVYKATARSLGIKPLPWYKPGRYLNTVQRGLKAKTKADELKGEILAYKVRPKARAEVRDLTAKMSNLEAQKMNTAKLLETQIGAKTEKLNELKAKASPDSAAAEQKLEKQISSYENQISRMQSRFNKEMSSFNAQIAGVADDRSHLVMFNSRPVGSTQNMVENLLVKRSPGEFVKEAFSIQSIAENFHLARLEAQEANLRRTQTKLIGSLQASEADAVNAKAALESKMVLEYNKKFGVEGEQLRSILPNGEIVKDLQARANYNNISEQHDVNLKNLMKQRIGMWQNEQMENIKSGNKGPNGDEADKVRDEQNKNQAKERRKEQKFKQDEQRRKEEEASNEKRRKDDVAADASHHAAEAARRAEDDKKKSQK